MKSNLAIFDYDGVIVDSMPHNLAVVRRTCERLGFSVFPDVDYCRTARCISFEEWARKIDMTEDQVVTFVRMIHDELTDTAHTLESFEEVPAMLEKLSTRCECALITGNILSSAIRFLDEHKLTHFFSALYGAEHPGTKSAKIQRLAQDYGYPMSAVYYVGDAGTDVQQGRAAGAKTVAVTWGFQSRERLAEEKPDFLVDSPAELLQVLGV